MRTRIRQYPVREDEIPKIDEGAQGCTKAGETFPRQPTLHHNQGKKYECKMVHNAIVLHTLT